MSGSRRWANVALAIAAVLLLAAYPYRATWWGGLATHAGMAALVGGLADWYAVTALFRRPLGIRWQTEWIPRSREKIIGTAVHMVTAEILTVRNVYRALKQRSPFARILAWAEGLRPRWRTRLREWALEWPGYVDRDLFRGEWERIRRGALHGVEPADVLAVMVRVLLAGGVRSPWWRFLAQTVQTGVAAPQVAVWCAEVYRTMMYWERALHPLRTSIWESIAEWYEETPESIGAKVQARLVQAAASLGEEKSAASGYVRDFLQAALVRLETDEALRGRLRVWGRPYLAKELAQWDADRVWALAVTPERRAALADWAVAAVEREWTDFLADRERQRRAERGVFKLLARVLPKVQPFFGAATARELSKYSGAEMAELVENEVAEDLQIIRVNGTVIGGVLGAVFHLLSLALRGGGLP